MKRWRADSNGTAPVQVECELVGYPNVDADGQTQFVNTHFDYDVDAWLKLESERAAHVSLAGARIKECEERLRKAQEEAGFAARLFNEFRDNWASHGGPV